MVRHSTKSSTPTPSSSNIDIQIHRKGQDGSVVRLQAKNVRAAEADLDELAALVGRMTIVGTPVCSPNQDQQQQRPNTTLAPTVSVVCLKKPNPPKNRRSAETELDDLANMVGRISIGNKKRNNTPTTIMSMINQDNDEDTTAILGRYSDTVISKKTNQPVPIRRCVRIRR